jgi:hypothetical protein
MCTYGYACTRHQCTLNLNLVPPPTRTRWDSFAMVATILILHAPENEVRKHLQISIVPFAVFTDVSSSFTRHAQRYSVHCIHLIERERQDHIDPAHVHITHAQTLYTPVIHNFLCT